VFFLVIYRPLAYNLVIESGAIAPKKGNRRTRRTPMLNNQIAMFDVLDAPDPRDRYGSHDLSSYTTFVIHFSSGRIR
jgi:hypothetical protein